MRSGFCCIILKLSMNHFLYFMDGSNSHWARQSFSPNQNRASFQKSQWIELHSLDNTRSQRTPRVTWQLEQFWLAGCTDLIRRRVTEVCLSSFVFPDAAPTVSAARSHQSGAVNLNSILTANPKRCLFCPVGRQRVSDELPLIFVSGLRVNLWHSETLWQSSSSISGQ